MVIAVKSPGAADTSVMHDLLAAVGPVAFEFAAFAEDRVSRYECFYACGEGQIFEGLHRVLPSPLGGVPGVDAEGGSSVPHLAIRSRLDSRIYAAAPRPMSTARSAVHPAALPPQRPRVSTPPPRMLKKLCPPLLCFWATCMPQV